MRALILIAWLSGCAAGAQTSLSRDHFFQVGDHYARFPVDVSGITPGDEGPDQLWDFASLVPQEGEVGISFLAPAPGGQDADFPAANLVEVQQTSSATSSRYWTLDDAQMTLTGFAHTADGLSTVAPYDNTATLFTFPVDYQDQFTDTYSTQFSVSGVAVTRVGRFTTSADAFGTLVLPTGTFADVLRLKTVHELEQQASVPGLPTHVSTTSYAWYAPGIRYPVFTYAEKTELVAGSAVTTTNGWYTNVTPGAQVPDRYIAHLAAFAGNFTSNVLVRNSGTAESTVNLHPFTGDGTAAPIQPYTLAAGELLSLTHEQLGTGTSHLGISGCPSCKVTVGYQAAGGGGTAHVNQTTSGREFYMYPGEWDVLFDGMALVNLGDTAATVSAALLDENGAAVGSSLDLSNGLAPNGKLLADFAGRFNNQSGRVIRVNSSQPAVVLFLRGSLDGRFLYQNPPLEAGSTDRWLPHLSTFGGDFVSEVLVHNLGDSAQTVTLQPYTDGTGLAAVTTTNLAPGQTQVLSHQQLGTGAQFLRATGGGDCVVSVGYRASNGGGTAHVHQTQPGTRWLAYPGEREVLWDGLALVNAGSGNAVFSAEVLDRAGAVVGSATLGSRDTLNKLLANLSLTFAEHSGLTLRISSDKDAAILLLRGSLDGRFLYHNVPL